MLIGLMYIYTIGSEKSNLSEINFQHISFKKVLECICISSFLHTRFLLAFNFLDIKACLVCLLIKILLLEWPRWIKNVATLSNSFFNYTHLINSLFNIYCKEKKCYLLARALESF